MGLPTLLSSDNSDVVKCGTETLQARTMNSDDPLASTCHLGMCEIDIHTSHCPPKANSIVDRKTIHDYY